MNLNEYIINGEDEFSQEAILQQSRSLVQPIRRWCEVNSRNPSRTDVSTLGPILNEVFNGNFKVNRSQHPYNASCVVPALRGKLHVLDMRFKVRDTFANGGDVAGALLKDPGWIDPADATLHGAFSKMPLVLTLDGAGLLRQYTPGMVTGVILHEIGHAFNNLQMLDRLYLGNEVINDYMRGNNIPTKYYEKFHDKEALQTILREKDKEKGKSQIALILNHEVSSLSNANYYDASNSEGLADLFASKLGYAKELFLIREEFRKAKPTAEGNINLVDLSVNLKDILSTHTDLDENSAMQIAISTTNPKQRNPNGEHDYPDPAIMAKRFLQFTINRIRMMSHDKQEVALLNNEYREMAEILKKRPTKVSLEVTRLVNKNITAAEITANSIQRLHLAIENLINNRLHLTYT